MRFLIQNSNLSIRLSLTILRLVGFWPPEHLHGSMRILYRLYFIFTFMFLLGIYLIIQTVDLFVIWGNLPLMTATSFLLFTNLAMALKIVNMIYRKQTILAIIKDIDDELNAADSEEARDIVKRCDRETSLLQLIFFLLTVVTTLGWASSAEKNKLPLRAWYPYDTSKSPMYELTYVHQVGALFMCAYLNVGKDTLVTSLISQCRCRLNLLRLSLRTLCRDLPVGNDLMFTPEQEAVVSSRLRRCVERHNAALEAALQLQTCFSAPTFAQFAVSLLIICVTAFQLVSQTGNPVRLFSMGTYLLNMMFQVYIYCYEGNQLSEVSSEIADAAYECPWYSFSVKLRKSLLVLMTRTRRAARLTAGGFTTLSLASFMAIIKASYSLFTLLQQVDEKH